MPDVELFDDQGERPMQESCRQEFFFEHTLDTWSGAASLGTQGTEYVRMSFSGR